MEKKPLLDPCFRALVLVCLTLTITGCSLPRIAILHDPLTPEEHVNLGVSYEKRGELDEALREYTVAAKKLPLANLYAGNILFQKKEYGQAEKSYKKAIQKAQSPDAYNNLAWLYYTIERNLDEAERLAGKAVELAPESPGFKDTLETIRGKRGKGSP
jgi:tetratricopeptide (TPR) repeat protein